MTGWMNICITTSVLVIALIVFGIAFIVVERMVKNRKPRIERIGQINYGHAFVIGLFQLLAAIFPGTSLPQAQP